jgi:hypothetical protein
MKFHGTLVPALLTFLLAPGTAFAQDPPSRVARLNWLSGNVSFQPAEVDTWTAATLNYPLTTGDHIYTDSGARAEIHVGPNAIRLNSQSNFGFLNLDDRTVQARFTEGAMEVRLRRLEDDDIYEVDTPQGAVSLLRTGDYRIDADPSRNATMITVWSGEADVSANGRSFIVHARQTAYLADGQDADIRDANSPDDFDNFVSDRNSREDRVPPPVHVSQSMVGYEDLDQYGSWNQSPDYGWVWAPRVAADWAPYHQGRWAWVDPWGWTWIDEAPWGFAPFHYGRWAHAGRGWVWVPGAVVARPVYAPALVAFVGGPRFGMSLSIGGGGAVAWFPLGPREPFYPAYRVSNTYIRQVNITHVTNVNVTNVNVTNVRYVNQQVPGAVFAMPERGFVTARPVREFGQRVQPQQLAQGQIVGTAPQIAPRRESIIGIQTNRTVAMPSQAVMSRQVVARSTPPPPAVSFQARQQMMIEQNQGRPLAPEQVMQLRQQPGAVINRPAIQTVPRTVPGAPVPQQGFGRQADPNRPVDNRVDRPIDRMQTRPPNVQAPRQETPRPQEALRPQEAPRPQEVPRQQVVPSPRETARPQDVPRRPDFTRPSPENRPAPAVVPRPGPRPQPEVRRESAPVTREPRAQPAPAPAPRREDRPAPVREQRRDDRKEEKKDK